MTFAPRDIKDVANLVAKKLEDYMNVERRENRFQPAGCFRTTKKMQGYDLLTRVMETSDLDNLPSSSAKRKNSPARKSPRNKSPEVKVKRFPRSRTKERETTKKHKVQGKGDAHKRGEVDKRKERDTTVSDKETWTRLIDDKPEYSSPSVKVKIEPKLVNTSRTVVAKKEAARLSEYASHVFEEQPLDKLQVIHRYRPNSMDIPHVTENGKVQNYSCHYGSALHTKKYIDYYMKEGLQSGKKEYSKRLQQLRTKDTSSDRESERSSIQTINGKLVDYRDRESASDKSRGKLPPINSTSPSELVSPRSTISTRSSDSAASSYSRYTSSSFSSGLPSSYKIISTSQARPKTARTLSPTHCSYSEPHPPLSDPGSPHSFTGRRVPFVKEAFGVHETFTVEAYSERTPFIPDNVMVERASSTTDLLPVLDSCTQTPRNAYTQTSKEEVLLDVDTSDIVESNIEPLPVNNFVHQETQTPRSAIKKKKKKKKEKHSREKDLMIETTDADDVLSSSRTLTSSISSRSRKSSRRCGGISSVSDVDLSVTDTDTRTSASAYTETSYSVETIKSSNAKICQTSFSQKSFYSNPPSESEELYQQTRTIEASTSMDQGSMDASSLPNSTVHLYRSEDQIPEMSVGSDGYANSGMEEEPRADVASAEDYYSYDRAEEKEETLESETKPIVPSLDLGDDETFNLVEQTTQREDPSEIDDDDDDSKVEDRGDKASSVGDSIKDVEIEKQNDSMEVEQTQIEPIASVSEVPDDVEKTPQADQSAEKEHEQEKYENLKEIEMVDTQLEDGKTEEDNVEINNAKSNEAEDNNLEDNDVDVIEKLSESIDEGKRGSVEMSGIEEDPRGDMMFSDLDTTKEDYHGNFSPSDNRAGYRPINNEYTYVAEDRGCDEESFAEDSDSEEETFTPADQLKSESIENGEDLDVSSRGFIPQKRKESNASSYYSTLRAEGDMGPVYNPDLMERPVSRCSRMSSVRGTGSVTFQEQADTSSQDLGSLNETQNLLTEEDIDEMIKDEYAFLDEFATDFVNIVLEKACKEISIKSLEAISVQRPPKEVDATLRGAEEQFSLLESEVHDEKEYQSRGNESEIQENKILEDQESKESNSADVESIENGSVRTSVRGSSGITPPASVISSRGLDEDLPVLENMSAKEHGKDENEPVHIESVLNETIIAGQIEECYPVSKDSELMQDETSGLDDSRLENDKSISAGPRGNSSEGVLAVSLTERRAELENSSEEKTTVESNGKKVHIEVPSQSALRPSSANSGQRTRVKSTRRPRSACKVAGSSRCEKKPTMQDDNSKSEEPSQKQSNQNDFVSFLDESRGCIEVQPCPSQESVITKEVPKDTVIQQNDTDKDTSRNVLAQNNPQVPCNETGDKDDLKETDGVSIKSTKDDTAASICIAPKQDSYDKTSTNTTKPDDTSNKVDTEEDLPTERGAGADSPRANIPVVRKLERSASVCSRGSDSEEDKSCMQDLTKDSDQTMNQQESRQEQSPEGQNTKMSMNALPDTEKATNIETATEHAQSHKQEECKAAETDTMKDERTNEENPEKDDKIIIYQSEPTKADQLPSLDEIMKPSDVLPIDSNDKSQQNIMKTKDSSSDKDDKITDSQSEPTNANHLPNLDEIMKPSDVLPIDSNDKSQQNIMNTKDSSSDAGEAENQLPEVNEICAPNDVLSMTCHTTDANETRVDPSQETPREQVHSASGNRVDDETELDEVFAPSDILPVDKDEEPELDEVFAPSDVLPVDKADIEASQTCLSTKDEKSPTFEKAKNSSPVRDDNPEERKKTDESGPHHHIPNINEVIPPVEILPVDERGTSQIGSVSENPNQTTSCVDDVVKEQSTVQRLSMNAQPGDKSEILENTPEVSDKSSSDVIDDKPFQHKEGISAQTTVEKEQSLASEQEHDKFTDDQTLSKFLHTSKQRGSITHRDADLNMDTVASFSKSQLKSNDNSIVSMLDTHSSDIDPEETVTSQNVPSEKETRQCLNFFTDENTISKETVVPQKDTKEDDPETKQVKKAVNYFDESAEQDQPSPLFESTNQSVMTDATLTEELDVSTSSSSSSSEDINSTQESMQYVRGENLDQNEYNNEDLSDQVANEPTQQEPEDRAVDIQNTSGTSVKPNSNEQGTYQPISEQLVTGQPNSENQEELKTTEQLNSEKPKTIDEDSLLASQEDIQCENPGESKEDIDDMEKSTLRGDENDREDNTANNQSDEHVLEDENIVYHNFVPEEKTNLCDEMSTLEQSAENRLKPCLQTTTPDLDTAVQLQNKPYVDDVTEQESDNTVVEDLANIQPGTRSPRTNSYNLVLTSDNSMKSRHDIAETELVPKGSLHNTIHAPRNLPPLLVASPPGSNRDVIFVAERKIQGTTSAAERVEAVGHLSTSKTITMATKDSFEHPSGSNVSLSRQESPRPTDVEACAVSSKEGNKKDNEHKIEMDNKSLTVKATSSSETVHQTRAEDEDQVKRGDNEAEQIKSQPIKDATGSTEAVIETPSTENVVDNNEDLKETQTEAGTNKSKSVSQDSSEETSNGHRIIFVAEPVPPPVKEAKVVKRSGGVILVSEKSEN